MSRPRGAVLPAVVVAREVVGDVVVLELAAPEGRRLPGWRAGAHLDVVIPASAVPGGATRQYSLIGDPAQPTWRIAVLRESAGRGGSEWMHTLAVGDEVRVAGPQSHFDLRPGAAPLVLIAGGVGITPISAMAFAARAAGREYRLHYAGRRGSMALLPELRELHGSRLVEHVTAEGTRLDLPELLGGDGSAGVYACGPARLID